MKSLDIIKKLCEKCIIEGEAVIKTEWVKDRAGRMVYLNPTVYVDLEKFTTWKSNCIVLLNLLGSHSKSWSSMIKESYSNEKVHAISMLGALRSIKETLENDLLIDIEDIVFAEAFSNLIEQAEYLFSQNYYLATGILCRAVMEEKLRNLSRSHLKIVLIE